MAHTAHIPVEFPRVAHHAQAGIVSAVSVADPANQNQQPYNAYYYGMPAAHENGQLQGIDLAISHAMSENPTFRNIRKETVCNVEIMNVVNQALKDIFQGNRLMYVPADEIQATIHALSQKVEEFKQASATNPTISIAHLKQQIGPGSHFAQKHKAHHMRHHPAHPNSHEPHLAPNTSLFGDPVERSVDGKVAESLHHHFGHPANSN